MDDADKAQDHIEREQPALLQQRQPARTDTERAVPLVRRVGVR